MFYEVLMEKKAEKEEKKRPSRGIRRVAGAGTGSTLGAVLATSAALPLALKGKMKMDHVPHAISGTAGLGAGLMAGHLGQDNLGAYGGGIAGGIAGSHLGGKLLEKKLPLGGHILGAGLGAYAGNRLGNYAHERIQARRK